MANPFSKLWNYLMAAFDNKIEENADPKVQIEQAIDEAQRQHQELSQQAAAVIGNQRQLEMQLNRRLGEVEKLQGNTRQALQLADKARAEGDEAKATEYENAAEAFAAQLVTAEESVEDTKKMHDQALQQAEQAKQAVERNAAALREKGEVEKLQGNTRQALQLADKARAEGDEAKATEYENAAEAFAAQLVTAEESVEDTKKMHDQALQQAEQAKQAVERNAAALREKVNERSKLLSQLEQAKMQEKVSDSLSSMNELTNGSTPSLDNVREKIERRYSRALGQAELAEDSVEGRMYEVQQAGIQMAGHSRLEQIRAEMNQGNSASARQVGAGQAGNSNNAIEAGQSGSAHQAAQPGNAAANDAVQARLRELRGE